MQERACFHKRRMPEPPACPLTLGKGRQSLTQIARELNGSSLLEIK